MPTSQPKQKFPPDRDFTLLTLKDVLDARDHYHIHLAHLPNVVGTAVGRYLVQEGDWCDTHDPRSTVKPPRFKNPTWPRTLFNSATRPWSSPCVLVFVSEWAHRGWFSKRPDNMVPRALFLPDGRVVPTCVVLVEDEPFPSVPEYHLSFPRSVVGGGFLTQAEVQGRQHISSIGCLVSDGDLTYALTNRHVTGPQGREIYTVAHDRRRLLGYSDAKQLGDKPFMEMYPGWSGASTQLQIDAGLIRVENLEGWTAQVAGIGPLDDWLDLNTDTLTLTLIDQKVRAFGAASGLLFGQISALFYRYATAGGREYVTDFLIRPRDGSSGTVHGDSGTVWFWEQEFTDGSMRLRPFALQWGGHVWTTAQGGTRRTGRFALATSLSLICRELGVTPVRDWNTNLPQYWGDVGHYTIGFFACDKIAGKLGTLMKANQTTVSYPHDSITSKTLIKKKGQGGFVPLADVPDRIWAHGLMIRGGADRTNHFADMDQKDPKNHSKTLLQLCEGDPANVDPDFWKQYYANVGDTGRGILPFRVWQFFDEMKDAATKKDATRFVAAAGICAHYVGDACQPLHCSFLHDGEPNGRGKGVHKAYEDVMLANNSSELLSLLANALKNASGKIPPPATGHAAAIATVDLMRRTFQTIGPQEIVDAFADGRDLWGLFREKTVRVLKDGVRTLQAIWKGAWKAGKGSAIGKSKLVAAELDELMALYLRKTWMPSKTIKTIKPILK